MIKTIELFAGVGGFSIGLEGWKGKSASSQFEKTFNSKYSIIWSNQWEPSTKIQHASKLYTSRWPEANHSNENIEDVVKNKFDSIPDHDLLVGGFPCQDYSVATTLNYSEGLVGKKGVLWWSIYNIIRKKRERKPKYVLLENVDRLLNSPSTQRGRDFAVILSCFHKEGYAVEWRVINSADYGMPQRRRRLFIIAYHKYSKLYQQNSSKSISELINSECVFSKALPHRSTTKISSGRIYKDFKRVSKEFNSECKKSPFREVGIMLNGKFYTCKSEPIFEGKPKTLGDILFDGKVENKFYIDKDQLVESRVIHQINKPTIYIKNKLDKWIYCKGSKHQWQINKLGIKYSYREGDVEFPDSLEKPSRTITTQEGKKSVSRLTHVIDEGDERYRTLTPVELERLNMFPDNHTKHPDISNAKRGFFMGNALVTGIVEKIGIELSKRILD